jgi:hypothetical protein
VYTHDIVSLATCWYRNWGYETGVNRIAWREFNCQEKPSGNLPDAEGNAIGLDAAE